MNGICTIILSPHVQVRYIHVLGTYTIISTSSYLTPFTIFFRQDCHTYIYSVYAIHVLVNGNKVRGNEAIVHIILNTKPYIT